METEERISLLKDFIEQEYQQKLMEHIKKDIKRLTIDYSKLLRFNPELADYLLDHPEEFYKEAEVAIEYFDMLGDVSKYKIRIRGVTDSIKMRIRDIRSKHIGKLIKIEGYVKTKADIRPNMCSIKFECPSCGNTINVLQLDEKVKEPTKCSCGRKGNFRIIHKELVDMFSIMLEESPESITAGTALAKEKVILRNDLTDVNIAERIYQGTKICVTGILKEVMITTHRGAKKTIMEHLVEANYVDFLDSSSLDLVLNQDDINKLKIFLQQSNIMEELLRRLFRGVYGLRKEKEGTILALVEGNTNMNTAPITNGKIHILFIGDTGGGKTTIMEALSPFIMKSRFVSGKGASGIGILGAVIRDEITGSFGAEAGALALACDGVCWVDETDKLDEKDRNALHQPMSQLKIDLHKGNVHATLLARTTVIAAANPKFGRFDKNEYLYEQLDLPDTLINRFDLIFVFKMGTDDKALDEEEKKAMTQLDRAEMIIPEEEKVFFKKVFAYLVKINAIIPNEIKQYISQKFKNLLAKGLKAERKYIPITQRQVGSIAKIAQAHAKLMKGGKSKDNTVIVDESDVDYAIELIDYCFREIAYDPYTGQIDLDKINIGISMSERSHLSTIKDIIKLLSEKIGDMPIDDIYEVGIEAGIPKNRIESLLERLRNEGEIFEYRRGIFRKL